MTRGRENRTLFAMVKPFLLRLATGVLLGAVSTAAMCAPYQRVGIRSVPEQAEVYVDGELVGTTPLELRVGVAQDHSVYVKKEGYQPRMVVLNRNQPADGIDFLTPADIRVRLVPRTGMPDRDVQVEVEPDAPE